MHTRQAKWLAVFLAFEPLFFLIQLRALGILIMLAVAAGYFITLSKDEMLRVMRASPVLAYPLLAVLSSLWSEDPAITFRLGLQFLITAALGVMLYRTIPIRIILSALYTAALFACIAALFFGYRSLFAGLPLSGVAESKNMMAFIATVAVLCGLALFLDAQTTARMRLIALVGGLYSAIILVAAQSAGALIGAVLGVGMMIAGRFFLSASSAVRTLIVIAVLLMVPVGIISQGVIASEATTFSEDVLGKDTTLTGRTYLWQRAAEYIAEKPIVGHGYGAFWRKGSVEAEGLWRWAGLESTQTGFNFHNQFIEAAMDVGYLGLIIFVLTLMWSALSLGVRLLRERDAELPFMAALFVALVVRTPVESVMLTQFNVITVLLFVMVTGAIYGQGRAPALAAARPQTWLQRRQRIRRVKQDKGLTQIRQRVQVKRKRKVVQSRAPRAVVRTHKRRGKRVLRQTRPGVLRPEPAPSEPSET